MQETLKKIVGELEKEKARLIKKKKEIAKMAMRR